MAERIGRALWLLAALAPAACKDPPRSEPAAASASAASSAPAAPSASEEPTNPYPPEKIEGILNPSKLPAYSGPTGSIEGVVSVRGPAAPRTPRNFSKCPEAEGIYGSLFREGPPVGAGRALGDAIVAVTGYDKFVPPKSDKVSITFEGCGYPSRTVLLTFGQRLEVLNGSKHLMVAPDIESSKMVALVLLAPRSISSAKLYPPTPGRFRLIDRGPLGFLHADVYVLLQSLHAVTSTDGHFRIDGIPVGKVTLNTAHPSFTGDASAVVDVMPGVVHKVDLVLTYPGEGDAGAPDAGSSRPAKADAGPSRPGAIIR